MLRRNREHRFCVGEFGRQDDLDVVVEHLGIGRRRAFVVAVDEESRLDILLVQEIQQLVRVLKSRIGIGRVENGWGGK